MQREKVVKWALWWFDIMGVVCAMALAVSFLINMAASMGPEWAVTVYFNKAGEAIGEVGIMIFTFVWGVSRAYRTLRSMP